TEMVASKYTKDGTSPTKVGTITGIMRDIMYCMVMRMLLALYVLAYSMYGASFTCRNMSRYDLMLALNMLRATQMAVRNSKLRSTSVPIMISSGYPGSIMLISVMR